MTIVKFAFHFGFRENLFRGEEGVETWAKQKRRIIGADMPIEVLFPVQSGLSMNHCIAMLSADWFFFSLLINQNIFFKETIIKNRNQIYKKYL